MYSPCQVFPWTNPNMALVTPRGWRVTRRVLDLHVGKGNVCTSISVTIFIIIKLVSIKIQNMLSNSTNQKYHFSFKILVLVLALDMLNTRI